MLKKKSVVAKKKRRKLSAEFKAKVALAALREDKTLAHLCAEFQVGSTQITEWKRLLVERVAVAFASGAGADLLPAIDVVPLHAKIGDLTLKDDPRLRRDKLFRTCAHQGRTAERKSIIDRNHASPLSNKLRPLASTVPLIYVDSKICVGMSRQTPQLLKR